jgi:replicative DNA helicase
MGYQEDVDLDTLLDKAEQKLFSVSQKHMKQNFVPITEILHETFDRLDELHREKGKLRGVPTGFTDLDAKLGGLQNSDLVILAARPSMGKTSLALDMIRHVALEEKKSTAIFSLEMSKDQLVDRLLSAEADVDLWKMRTGRLSDVGVNNDFERIGHALGRLSEAQIFIDDTGALNIMELRTKARRLQAENQLDLIVVDYLQLMQGHSKDNRVQEVSEISRSLKLLAKELNVPVLALSQLSRNVEQRGNDKRPQLSDLRESGSIEQDADVVMFIFRDEMYTGADTKKPHIAEILIRKHRNGPTGEIELYFDGEKTSFKNLAKSQSSEDVMMEQIMQ